jgi:hypothetical protein
VSQENDEGGGISQFNLQCYPFISCKPSILQVTDYAEKEGANPALIRIPDNCPYSRARKEGPCLLGGAWEGVNTLELRMAICQLW